MFALSAIDTVMPAIYRTRDFLFRPFRPGTYLKLCLVACITEGFGGFQFSIPGSHPPHHHHVHPDPTALLTPGLPMRMLTPGRLTPGWIAAIVTAALLLIVLGFVLAYLVTRLRFAYFHCLTHNIKEILPGWRHYRPQATRFFWLTLVVGLSFLLVMAIVALPFVAAFWRLFHNLPPGRHPTVGAIFSLLLPLIPVALLFVVAAIAAQLILRDWMLPHFALENASAGEAWRHAWAHIRDDKAAFFVYALLRIMLPIAAMIAIVLVLIIPAIVFFAAVVFAEVAIHAALSHAAGAAPLVGLALQILVGVLVFCIALLISIGLGGLISTATREYALLFYGSRYQPLANLLWPPLPQPPPQTA